MPLGHTEEKLRVNHSEMCVRGGVCTTVSDKSISVILSPSCSYGHKHITRPCTENNGIKQLFLIRSIVWRGRLVLGIYLLVLIHTFSFVRGIIPVLFSRGWLERSVRASCEMHYCLIVALGPSAELQIGFIIEMYSSRATGVEKNRANVFISRTGHAKMLKLFQQCSVISNILIPLKVKPASHKHQTGWSISFRPTESNVTSHLIRNNTMYRSQ